MIVTVGQQTFDSSKEQIVLKLTAEEKHAVKIMGPTESVLDSGEFDRFDDYE